MSDMDAASLEMEMEKLAVDSEPSQLSFEGRFLVDWEWYIRLKVTFPYHDTAGDIEPGMNGLLTEFGGFWHSLKSELRLQEGEMWQTPLVDTDTSNGYLFLIGIPRLGSKEMGNVRLRVRDWVKGARERKGGGGVLEGKIVSKKVASEGGFEVYRAEDRGEEVKGSKAEGNGNGNGEVEVEGSRKSKKQRKGGVPAAGGFKKVEGSNPAEVRRQFLEHSMKNSAASSSLSATNNASSGKLRPGKEVLNRMKFDEKYDIGEFVVGYIDRKDGILETSVGKWDAFGREEVMAYVRNTKSGEIVWDKARRVDLVFGGKGEGDG